MIEENEVIEAPRRPWAWAFAKVVVLGMAVGGLTWGGSRTMEIVRHQWPLLKARAATMAWERIEAADAWLVSDHELIELFAADAGGQEPGAVALVTGIARSVPGAQFKSCGTGQGRREVIQCQVGIVRECWAQSRGARDRSATLYATLGCIGGTTWQQAAMREVSEVLIEGAV